MKVCWDVADDKCVDKDAVAFICIKDIKREANAFNDGENLAFDINKSDAIELIKVLLKGMIKNAFK
jgi:hypothetical protein